jgi:hypothetical protein
MGASQSVNAKVAADNAEKENKKPTAVAARVLVTDEDAESGQSVSGANFFAKQSSPLAPRGNVFRSALLDEAQREAQAKQFLMGKDCISRDQELLAHSRAEERRSRRTPAPGTEKIESVANYDRESAILLRQFNEKKNAVSAGKPRSADSLDAVGTGGRDSIAKKPLFAHKAQYIDLE